MLGSDQGRFRLGVAALAVLALAPAAKATAGTLPDGRGYEVVSPREKNGSDVDTGVGSAVSASDGGAVAYVTVGSYGGSSSAGATSVYVGRRADSGWGVQAISPPLLPDFVVANSGFQAFSSDLSRGLLSTADGALTPDASARATNLYIADTTTGSYRLLTPAPLQNSFGSVFVGGVSTDLRHVVYEDASQLTAAAPFDGGSPNVYDWADGDLHLVNVLPDGSIGQFAVIGGGAQDANPTAVEHAVSSDGSRIFFTSPALGSTPNGQLYVRVDDAVTLEASASQRSTADPDGPRNATFQTAADDGSAVFFTSAAKLTDDATTGPGDAGMDLYRYDVVDPAHPLTDLTVDGADANGAQVLGVVGASDDARIVYFVAAGVLASGGVAGQPNLYVRQGSTTRFIATLAAGDFNDWNGGTQLRTSRVTPDGEHLLYTSAAQQPDYDNAGFGEVYLYDAGAHQSRCVSCRPDGRPATANASLNNPIPLTSAPYAPRNVSDDGSRVYFNTGDVLSSDDSNGKVDVYEYERGAPQLISSGQGASDSWFGDSDRAGNDVYFTTRDRLVPQDQDDNIDLYDARIGGGFPLATPQPACMDDSCQGFPASPPTVPAAGSASFAGPGDVIEAAPRPAPTFKVAAISAAMLKRFAKTGAVALPVTVDQAGKVSATVTARIGRHARTIAKGTATASKRRTVHVTLRLSKAARAQLAKQKKLKLGISVSYSKVKGAVQKTVTLHR